MVAQTEPTEAQQLYRYVHVTRLLSAMWVPVPSGRSVEMASVAYSARISASMQQIGQEQERGTASSGPDPINTRTAHAALHPQSFGERGHKNASRGSGALAKTALPMRAATQRRTQRHHRDRHSTPPRNAAEQLHAELITHT